MIQYGFSSFSRFSGMLPSQKHLSTALNRIEPLEVRTLACHHGSVLTGDPARYYRAVRENSVGDIVNAPFYERRAPAAGHKGMTPVMHQAVITRIAIQMIFRRRAKTEKLTRPPTHRLTASFAVYSNERKRF